MSLRNYVSTEIFIFNDEKINKSRVNFLLTNICISVVCEIIECSNVVLAILSGAKIENN